MKIITPEQAQQLANIIGQFIAVDECGEAYAYQKKPIKLFNGYCTSDDKHNGFYMPISITDSRPWTKQIWRPEE